MAWQQGLHSFVDPAQAAVHATRAELQAAWNSGIATCAKGPGRSAWRRAVALFEATTAQRLQADIVTCNACLSAYGKAEHWKAVLKILGSTAQKSLRNSVISYGIAITCSDWTQSQHLLKQLKDEFLETNAISYNSAMASGEALGPLAPLAPLAWKSAEGLLAKMSNEGCSADVISYNAQLHHLANGHGRHGHHGHHGRLPAWSRAVHLVKQLQCRGLQPTTVTFNSAMTSSAWEGIEEGDTPLSDKDTDLPSESSLPHQLP